MTNLFLQLISVFAQLATITGIWLLAWQIVSAKRISKAQIINELEREFAGYYTVFQNLKPSGRWRDRVHLAPAEVVELENLASFCEKLKHFLDLGALDWIVLDRMFRNRFFLIVDNPNVREQLIQESFDDWQSLMEIEKEWRSRLPASDRRSHPPAKQEDSPTEGTE